MQQFNYISDAGHGWLEIPYQVLVDLKIEDKISGCSYRYGDMCYLEEDCDAGVFVRRAVEVGFEHTINDVYHEGNSRIRNYKRYEKP